MTPPNPYLINGYVYGLDGTFVIDSASLTFTNGTTSETLTATTSNEGQYVVDIANFTSGYTIGDIITIVAVKIGIGKKTETVTVDSGGGQQKNLTLEEFSDVEYEKGTRQQLVKSIPTHFDGGDVRISAPLPVMDSFAPGKHNEKLELNYNTNDELIWIYRTVNGVRYDRNVTDGGYSGGTTKADITRTKTFLAWVR